MTTYLTRLTVQLTRSRTLLMTPGLTTTGTECRPSCTTTKPSGPSTGRPPVSGTSTTATLWRVSIELERSPHSLSDTQVDGNLTLGENLADHGGLSMALEAYTNWRNHNTDVKLPALPFNDMQLFFIGYALPWCSRHTKKHSRSQV